MHNQYLLTLWPFSLLRHLNFSIHWTWTSKFFPTTMLSHLPFPLLGIFPPLPSHYWPLLILQGFKCHFLKKPLFSQGTLCSSFITHITVTFIYLFEFTSLFSMSLAILSFIVVKMKGFGTLFQWCWWEQIGKWIFHLLCGRSRQNDFLHILVLVSWARSCIPSQGKQVLLWFSCLVLMRSIIEAVVGRVS